MKKIILILIVSVMGVMLAMQVNLNATAQHKGLTLKNIEALANDETNPYYEAGYFYCRCKNDASGSKKCFGGNAVSLRSNCYKGAYGGSNCRTYDSNCR